VIKKNPILTLLPFLIVIGVFTAGCTPPETPYLILQTNGPYYYDTGSTAEDSDFTNVDINYYFFAERDNHTCRITIEKIQFPDNEVVVSEDMLLYREGTIRYGLADGSYRLTFTVLSKRGAIYHELLFLNETVEFTVMPS
jgi:hypothetical protein